MTPPGRQSLTIIPRFRAQKVGSTTEAGIRVCCPVHDALLIEAPLSEIEATVERTQQMMKKASEDVLNGFSLRTDVKIVRHPHRYSDRRGERMWQIITELLEVIQ